MKVLLVGRWAKTHALAMALRRNSDVRLYTMMDKLNGSITKISDKHWIDDITDKTKIKQTALDNKVDLVVVTPEMSLKTGIADLLIDEGIPTIGASKKCCILEGNKVFLRRLLIDHNFDAAVNYRDFDSKKAAGQYLLGSNKEYAIKPAGITDGDGVRVMGKQLAGKYEAIDYVDQIFDNCMGGLPHIIIEDKLEGEEFTLQAFSDGDTIIEMPAVRDYKLHYEEERGENTPGMGSFSDSNHLLPFLSKKEYNKGIDTLRKILCLMKSEYNTVYKGFITVQYMITKDGIKLIEINIRPGDAEILNIVPILETDFVEICMAIANSSLDKLSIKFKPQATVCKYIVPPGFPRPGKKPVRVDINKKAIQQLGGHLFQSCFDIAGKFYEPSPRLFAVTAVADDILTAKETCDQCLEYFKGVDLYYRKDIGSKKLMEYYYGIKKSVI